MKKLLPMLVLGIAFLVAGCGNEDTKAPHESQKTEEANITGNTETESKTEEKSQTEAESQTKAESKTEEKSQTEAESQTETESQTEEKKNADVSNYDDYMTSIKEKSDIIKTSLEQDTLTQMDMNSKSQELYELWDDALNYLWGELKVRLPEEEFSKLLDEQRIWISEKETSAEEAGKEAEGGSSNPLVVNMENAKITEERVYELYELLK